MSDLNRDTVFRLNYGVCLPVFVLGALLNGWIAVAAVLDRTRTIRSRLDKVLWVLTCIFCLWCFASVVRAGLELPSVGVHIPINVLQAYTSLFIMLIFGANLVLAMERYFMISGEPDEQNRNHFIAALVALSLLTCSVVFSAIFFPSSNSPLKAAETELDTWFTIVSPPMMITIMYLLLIGTLGLYVSTYMTSTRRLRQSLRNRKQRRGRHGADLDTVRLRVERKILFSCVAMAGSLVLCYLPIIVVVMFRTFSGADNAGRDMTWPLLFSNFLLSLDGLLSPALVLHFMPNFRKPMFPTRSISECEPV
ncbi:hypothetical protein HDU81_006745 [Chytriomyces hyalinus]|nr:hypothetical protein HDU81_006745 [Chytriomyces hyalinus]